MVYNLWCFVCDAKFTKEVNASEVFIYKNKNIGVDCEGIKCPFCDSGVAKIMGRPTAAIMTGKCDQPTAVMVDDKTGKEYEVNSRGRVLNHRKYENDARGWRRKGKKSIREFDKYGNKNNR